MPAGLTNVVMSSISCFPQGRGKEKSIRPGNGNIPRRTELCNQSLMLALKASRIFHESCLCHCFSQRRWMLQMISGQKDAMVRAMRRERGSRCGLGTGSPRLHEITFLESSWTAVIRLYLSVVISGLIASRRVTDQEYVRWPSPNCRQPLSVS